MTIGVSQILALVSICLAITAFTLQMEQSHTRDADDNVDMSGVDTADHVFVGAFAANCMSFILVWFIAGSPCDHEGAWNVTFSFHTLIAGILTMIWVIMGSEEKPTAGDGDQQIASIVLSAVNFPILIYLGISMYLCKIAALKDNIKQLLCVFSFLLTITAFAVWMTVDTFAAGTIAPVFIAGSCAAFLAGIDGLFIGNEQSFTFTSFVSSILLAITFIFAALTPPPQTPAFLVGIILTAVNAAVLFAMGCKAQMERVKAKSLVEMVIIGICLLTIVQFTIAMSLRVGLAWNFSILCWGAACVFMGVFFSFIHFDHNARGVHMFMALIAYVIYFVSECVVSADAGAVASTRAEKASITALVFAALNCALLTLATFLTFPHYKKANEVEPAQEMDEEEKS